MKTERVLKAMKFLSWFVFAGLVIKIGFITIAYFLSVKNIEMSNNLYGGINLYEDSVLQFSFIVGYKFLLCAIEAYITFLVIRLLRNLNVKEPFNVFVRKLMEQISYGIFYLWGLAIAHNMHMQFIAKKHDFYVDLISIDFVFLSAIIFVFAQIVKRGIEIQQENDLTI